MVICMKTTVEIPDALFIELKMFAARKNMTIRSIVEIALRQFFASEKKGPKGFKLRDGSVPGQGLQPAIRQGGWRQIRELNRP